MVHFKVSLFLALCVIKPLEAAPSDGKEIADKLGEDLSFASKQIIRGFTAIFAPLIDSAQSGGLMKAIPLPLSHHSTEVNEAAGNFRNVLLRDGVNAIGKGVKAGATIISAPARIAGVGLEEARKAAAAGTESRTGSSETKKHQVPVGNIPSRIDDGSKIASTLLNTTATKFSQANLGAVLLEVALKNRIKDIANKSIPVKPAEGSKIGTRDVRSKVDSDSSSKSAQPATPSQVDIWIERFNEAMSRNDEQLMNAVRTIIDRINPKS